MPHPAKAFRDGTQTLAALLKDDIAAELDVTTLQGIKFTTNFLHNID